jgi:pimeloyl-ACP methyl ester carboxylesterase
MRDVLCAPRSCTAAHRRFFDPAAYRIILFDQRGAGGSVPHACLGAPHARTTQPFSCTPRHSADACTPPLLAEDNTTWHLVADIEALRAHLGVDTWQVFGGSWGSTLALAYAQTHPARVTELVLRGIFMLRPAEINWYYQGAGAEFIFPDAWEDYVKPIPASERGDMVSAYHRLLTGDDVAKREGAAAAWTRWEMATSSLKVKQEDVARCARGAALRCAACFACVHRCCVSGGCDDACACLALRCAPACVRLRRALRARPAAALQMRRPRPLTRRALRAFRFAALQRGRRQVRARVCAH